MDLFSIKFILTKILENNKQDVKLFQIFYQHLLINIINITVCTIYTVKCCFVYNDSNYCTSIKHKAPVHFTHVHIRVQCVVELYLMGLLELIFTKFFL